MVHQGRLYIFLTAAPGMDEGLGCRLVLAYIRFSQNSGFLMLKAYHAGFPSCDPFNAYDLKNSLVSERIIVENVTCNPLLLHSAGQVIDFQKKKVDCRAPAGEEQREALLDCGETLDWEAVVAFGRVFQRFGL